MDSRDDMTNILSEMIKILDDVLLRSHLNVPMILLCNEDDLYENNEQLAEKLSKKLIRDFSLQRIDYVNFNQLKSEISRWKYSTSGFIIHHHPLTWKDLTKFENEVRKDLNENNQKI